MIKVIETNLMIRDNEVTDFQSRVIEVESWDSYIEEVNNSIPVERRDMIGTMHGYTVSPNKYIETLFVDDNKISCNVFTVDEVLWSRKLSYRVR